MPEQDSSIERAKKIRDSLPKDGLFAEKEWRISPDPFPIDRKTFRQLEKLGPVLWKFQQAADTIYRRSRKGTLPDWIAGYLERGKPDALLEAGLESDVVEAVPAVIRPDLILTEDGFAITELDSVPGGIGLTAWLGETYAGTKPEEKIIGGADGMLRGFESIFSSSNVDIAISEESSDYRPEMEWLAGQLDGDFQVHSAENFTAKTDRDIYRFFELFDLPNLPGIEQSFGNPRVTPPFKPWLEEKMWAAILRMRPLRDVWRRELRDANFHRLLELFPWSWIVDPAELPHHAVLPKLEIQSFEELKNFSQTEREMVLKASGFSELAWGSRSVTIGQDVSQDDWASAIDSALENFESSPFVLQEFHRGKVVQHRWFNPDSGELEIMDARVRLCPYYFAEFGSKGKKVRLGGILATICPSDKKILHGMRDAILAPCAVMD
ncbi:MAG: hypothetical protein HKN23_17740 [Verrucomicrobiales bacterium]|nr:hypothetical protein [Verrucomicrobiales bacterium]